MPRTKIFLPTIHIIGLILLVLPMATCQQEHGTFLYVSPNGNDSWTGNLPDPNQARTDGPLSTILAAQERVREEVAKGLTGNLKVLIRSGTYYLPEGLELTPQDSGTKQYSVTFAAYPNENATLVGGIRLHNWTNHHGGIWKTAIPDGCQPNQVFENGRRMEIARTPKIGYYQIEGPVKGRERTAFVYDEKDLDPRGWDLSDARVFMWPGHDWFSKEKEIVSINHTNQTITMGSGEGYEMIPGNRYRILNVLSLLQAPGECQIDSSKGLIYCWPDGDNIENRTMVIPTAENVITVRAPWQNPVRNLHIEGLDLGISREDVVLFDGAENCSISSCLIENGGRNGVYAIYHSQGIEIQGNLIRNNGQHGVSILGPAPGGENMNHHNLVQNNHIHHCGRMVGHGYGVHIYQSGNNRIIHNDIHHMPRYGTTIKGLRFQVLRENVPGVTWENHYQYLHSRENLIAYNHIHHVNLDSQDTGAMESWGPGRDNTYDHNLIHDVGNEQFGLQSGIYLDDATDHFRVTNNIIYNVTGAGGDQCIFAKGIGNLIENNILIVAPGNTAAIRNMEMGGERGDSHRYLRNIFYFQSSDGDVYGFVNWAPDRVKESDYNLFWKPNGTLTISGGPAEGDFSKWLKLFGGKYDQHSIIANPMFADIQENNFTLDPGSPVLKNGFRQIDTGQIGLLDDFPKRLRIDPIYPRPTCRLQEATTLPSEIAQGQNKTLSIKVDCEEHENTEVRVDMAPLGGNYPRLYDDGTHGDTLAGDGRFSLRVSIPENTPLGKYTIGVSVEQGGMRSTGTIIIHILPGRDYPIYQEGIGPTWKAEFVGETATDLLWTEDPFRGRFCQRIRLERGSSVRYRYTQPSGLPMRGFTSLYLEMKPLDLDAGKLILQGSGGQGTTSLSLAQIAPDLVQGQWNHLEIPLVDLGLEQSLDYIRLVSLGSADLQIDDIGIRSEVPEILLPLLAPLVSLLLMNSREEHN